MNAHTVQRIRARAGWRHRHVARRVSTGALVFAAAAGAPAADAPAANCPNTDRAPSLQSRDEAAAATLCLLNRERARRALPRLRVHRSLQRAGRHYARAMVRGRFFSHTAPTGASMVDRLRDVGYATVNRSWRVGEALAWGLGTRATPAATVAAWLGSPPHRHLLLDATFRDVGIGVAPGVPITGVHDARAGATYAVELGVRR